MGVEWSLDEVVSCNTPGFRPTNKQTDYVGIYLLLASKAPLSAVWSKSFGASNLDTVIGTYCCWEDGMNRQHWDMWDSEVSGI